MVPFPDGPTCFGLLMLTLYFHVSVRPVTLMQPLSDLTVCEGDIAQMEVRFSQENVEGAWMKNGQPVVASNRVHMVIDRQTHKLLVEDTIREDLGTYTFQVPAQGISTSAKLVVQSKEPHRYGASVDDNDMSCF